MRAIIIAVLVPITALIGETADAAKRRQPHRGRQKIDVHTSTTVTTTRATPRMRVHPTTATATHCVDTTVLTATNEAALRSALTSLFEHTPCVAGGVRLRVSSFHRDLSMGISYLTVVVDGREIVVMGFDTRALAQQVMIEMSWQRRSTRAPHATSPERPP